MLQQLRNKKEENNKYFLTNFLYLQKIHINRTVRVAKCYHLANVIIFHQDPEQTIFLKTEIRTNVITNLMLSNQIAITSVQLVFGIGSLNPGYGKELISFTVCLIEGRQTFSTSCVCVVFPKVKVKGHISIIFKTFTFNMFFPFLFILQFIHF